MTIACTDCSRCGKCYDKHSNCKACGADINLLDDACPSCGEPITDAMRETARQAYIAKRKNDHDQVIALAAAAKAKRKAQARPKPVYPWEQ